MENPYLDFNPEQLKSKTEYTKNFNPGNYKSNILYNCMLDMINLARAEYFFLDPLKTDKDMDDCAQMQADYQAQKDEKGVLNEPPYRTTFFRLKKYGLTYHAIELVSKAKATLGTQEYSYYDLCFEILKPILKNGKTARQLLDKQYTYIGMGFETDEYMKSMYTSFILGNDLTFNPDKPDPMAKDLPYSKGKSGITYSDEKICAKCSADKNLEALSEYIQVKDNEVFINCGDQKHLKKLIGKEGDAIVLDFIQYSQYDCDGNTIDNDRINRGFVTKPILFEKMLDDNTIKDKKSSKLYAKIATVPEMVDKNAEFNVNIIVLKEGKYACRTIIKKAVECKKAAYQARINYKPDYASMKSAGEWMAAAEEGTHEVKYPFTLNKLAYTQADLDSSIQAIDAPAYTIQSIDIIAQNSLNYSADQTQINNQKKRALSVQKTLAQMYPGVATTITYDDGWEDFKRDVNNNPEHYDLTLYSKAEAIKNLKANNNAIAKELEDEYLSKHRYIKLVFHVVYKAGNNAEAENFTAWKFNQAMKDKNYALATAIQNFMIKKVEAGEYGISAVNQLEIPADKKFQQLHNNKLYMQYYLSSELNDKIVSNMNKTLAYEPNNPVVLYNVSVGKVFHTPINSIADIAKTQAEIDKLYSFPTLPKEDVNNLNLEYQFKIIEYINANPPTSEGTALYNSTFEKIKSITNKKLESWQNAYKLASYFVKNYDYMYAMSIMEPFLDDATISNDFLFSYVSLAAHREETYLSSFFTKAVKMAAERDGARLCGLFDKLPICVFDNAEVKKMVCKLCGR
ncbi:MAG: hypothetical protein J5644_05090 [Bacteroidales bacterium]|nr:hypothetical protein [Bacteroidales bacterium]